MSGDEGKEWVCVEGVLTNKRVMGKRLVFIDVKREGGLDAVLREQQARLPLPEGEPTSRKRKRDEPTSGGEGVATDESKHLIECCFSAAKFQADQSERPWPERPQDLTLGDEIRVEGVLRAKCPRFHSCTLEVMRWALLKPFDHSYRFQPSRRVAFTARKPLSARARRVALTHEGGVNVYSSTTATTTTATHSTVSTRARLFSDFLATHMGDATLRAGVLDIAGGKGMLAWELQVRRGCSATVVDPRPMAAKLPRRMRKELRKRCGEGVGGPMHLCGMFDDTFVDGDAVWTARRRGHEDRAALELTRDERRALVHGAGVVVGMHPDEATEPIVDMALKLDKPFAVVPCCVFAHLFPERRLRGEPVVAYEDFVDYLQAKDASIRRGTLPMDGRNVVLYRTPADVAK